MNNDRMMLWQKVVEPKQTGELVDNVSPKKSPKFFSSIEASIDFGVGRDGLEPAKRDPGMSPSFLQIIINQSIEQLFELLVVFAEGLEPVPYLV